MSKPFEERTFTVAEFADAYAIGQRDPETVLGWMWANGFAETRKEMWEYRHPCDIRYCIEPEIAAAMFKARRARR